MRSALIALNFAMIVAGCAYKADPIAAPAYNVVTSFSSKVPGKWLLAVEAMSLNQTLRPSSLSCSAHSFLLELSEPFKTSVAQTLRNAFEQVEEIPAPIPGDQAQRRGARGLS